MQRQGGVLSRLCRPLHRSVNSAVPLFPSPLVRLIPLQLGSVRALLSLGANTRAVNSRKFTPLHVSAVGSWNHHMGPPQLGCACCPCPSQSDSHLGCATSASQSPCAHQRASPFSTIPSASFCPAVGGFPGAQRGGAVPAGGRCLRRCRARQGRMGEPGLQEQGRSGITVRLP